MHLNIINMYNSSVTVFGVEVAPSGKQVLLHSVYVTSDGQRVMEHNIVTVEDHGGKFDTHIQPLAMWIRSCNKEAEEEDGEVIMLLPADTFNTIQAWSKKEQLPIKFKIVPINPTNRSDNVMPTPDIMARELAHGNHQPCSCER